MEKFDEIFTENFSKMTESNLINLANIFAKNHHVTLSSKDDKPSYFSKILNHFLTNNNKIPT